MASPWFPFLRPLADPKLRLLCLPHAGGAASLYRLWTRGLPEGIEVWSAQPPGRETRLGEAPHRAMGPLVASLLEAVTPAMDRPVAIFGHSLGARVAFELARALRRAQLPAPVLLAVSGCEEPAVPSRVPGLHAEPEETLLRHLQALQGTPAEVLENRQLLELLLPSLRADFELLNAYAFAPEPPLDCPLVALGGTTDPVVPLAALQGWAPHSTRFLGQRAFEGGHFFHLYRREEVVGSLVEALRPHL